MVHIINHHKWLAAQAQAHTQAQQEAAANSTPSPSQPLLLNTSRWECFIRGLESSEANVRALIELYRDLHEMLRGMYTEVSTFYWHLPFF